MLRKLIAIQFLIIALVCTFQLGYTAHFCRNNFIGSKVFAGYAEVSCGMSKNSRSCERTLKLNGGCCENSFARFEFKDEFQVQLAPDFDLPVFELIFDNNFAWQPYVIKFPAKDIDFLLHPPPILKVPATALEMLQQLTI